MTNINVNKILRNNKSVLLAYDQGLEHGPSDLNEKNVDPKYIFDIALEGRYEGLIVNHGIAEKYYTSYFKEIPLIIKTTGKTNLGNNIPFSKQICSVDRAIKLGASAVGYTLFVGSPFEPEMFSDFAKVVETAHDYGIPVITWAYPRGPTIKNEQDTQILAYAARIGLELGADFLKMPYNDKPEEYKWVIKCAGKARILVRGGGKLPPDQFLKRTEEIMKTGVSGVAIGRNVWQNDKPFAMTKAIQAIVHQGKTFEEALQIYNQGQK